MSSPQQLTSAMTRRGAQDGTGEASTRSVGTPLAAVPFGRRDLQAMALIVAALTVLVCVPLFGNHHFYYFDDTAGGAYGQWFELGHQLAHGHLPLLNLDAWMAGNYSVEQFGLLNPVIWVISLGTQVVPNAAVLATTVKWFFLLVAGLGSYLLARNFGARRDFAVLAGIAAPLGGFTLFVDATTWVTNLEVWAYFPWIFWALRRFIRESRSYWPVFLVGYLIVTVNYVQGAIMIVLLFVTVLIDAAMNRDGHRALRALFAGIPLGLLVVSVFLPAILTSKVTIRDSSVTNSGMMTLTLNGLAVSSSPFASPDTTGFDSSRYAAAPYTYIAWFLPVLLLCSWRKVRALGAELFQPALLLLIAAAFAAGPSQLGPLRFPMRTMPWVALLVVTLSAVLFSHCLDPVAFTSVRLTVTLVVVALVLWLSYSAKPQSWLWQVIPAVLFAGYVCLVWWTGRRALSARRKDSWLSRVAVSMIVLTLVTSTTQLNHFASASEAHYGQQNQPSDVAALERTVPGATGETIMLGKGAAVGPKVWSVARYGNLAYLSGTAVINLYTPVGYQALSDELCMDAYYGVTCYDAARRLFEPVTQAGGTPLVDLMGLDTVEFVAPTRQDVSALMEKYRVPPGWSLTNVTDISFVWRRDGTVEPAGLPTWSSAGLSYRVIGNTSTELTVHVDAVPQAGGTLVLSRLAWPGYSVKGGTIADPTAGFLLTVDVPATSAGHDVTVRFRPPGWALEVSTFVLAWLLAAGCATVRMLRRRRARSAG